MTGKNIESQPSDTDSDVNFIAESEIAVIQICR